MVAFRLAEAEDLAADEGATLVGPSAEEAGLTAGAVREAAAAERARRGRRRRPSGPSRWRTAAKVLIAAVIVAAVCVGAVLGARQVYFLGTDEGGRLALYRGLPYELPLGIELYSEVETAPVQVASVPEDRRGSAIDHELRSRDDAVDLLDDLEQAAIAAAGARGARRGRRGRRGTAATGRRRPGRRRPQAGDGGRRDGAARNRDRDRAGN